MTQVRATAPERRYVFLLCGYLAFERNAGSWYALWPRWRAEVWCLRVAALWCPAPWALLGPPRACASLMVPSSYIPIIDTSTSLQPLLACVPHPPCCGRLCAAYRVHGDALLRGRSHGR